MPRPHSASRRTCPSRRPRPRSRAITSTPAARHPSAYSTCPRMVLRRLRPRIAPTWLARKTWAAALRSVPSSSPSWPASSLARRSEMSGAMWSNSAKMPPRSRCLSSNRSAARARCMCRSRSRTVRHGTPPAAIVRCSSTSWAARSGGRRLTSINMSTPLATASNSSPATTSSRSTSRPSPPMARASAPQSAWSP